MSEQERIARHIYVLQKRVKTYQMHIKALKLLLKGAKK